MARILSITINTELNPAINVHLDNGTIIIFKKFSGGLYYYYTTSMEHNIINIQDADCTFMNKLESNKTYFHQCEIKVANEERIPQQLVGCPSTKTPK